MAVAIFLCLSVNETSVRKVLTISLSRSSAARVCRRYQDNLFISALLTCEMAARLYAANLTEASWRKKSSAKIKAAVCKSRERKCRNESDGADKSSLIARLLTISKMSLKHYIFMHSKNRSISRSPLPAEIGKDACYQSKKIYICVRGEKNSNAASAKHQRK